MRNIAISQIFLTLIAAAGLSSCAENGTLSKEKVNNSMKSAEVSLNKAAEKTRESMKDLGPKFEGAKEKAKNMGPALAKVEQRVKSAGHELGKIGNQVGDVINNTAKDIKEDMGTHTPDKPSQKP
jgi:hypothetical protein